MANLNFNDNVGQYMTGCLYGDLWGEMGECAYSVKWRGWFFFLHPECMFGTCVGIGNGMLIWHVSVRTDFAIKF